MNFLVLFHIINVLTQETIFLNVFSFLAFSHWTIPSRLQVDYNGCQLQGTVMAGILSPTVVHSLTHSL